jgi:hypothetical protein
VKEAERRVVLFQELVGVVEVLAGLGNSAASAVEVFVLVAGRDPVADGIALVDGQRRLGQDSVPFPVDQRARKGLGQVSLTVGQ